MFGSSLLEVLPAYQHGARGTKVYVVRAIPVDGAARAQPRGRGSGRIGNAGLWGGICTAGAGGGIGGLAVRG